MNENKIETELFTLSDDSLYVIENMPFYHYKIDNIEEIKNYFANDYILYRLLYKRLNKDIDIIINKYDESYGITTNVILEKLEYNFLIMNRDIKIIIKLYTKLYISDFKDNSNWHVIKAIINSNIKKYLLKTYKIQNSGYKYYIDEKNLLKEIRRSKNKFLDKIQDFIKIHPGFSIFIVPIDNTPTIHIQPKCHITFSKDLDYLFSNDIINPEEYKLQFNKVNTPFYNATDFIGMTNYESGDSLMESPYEGESYMDYYNKYYDYEYKNKHAKLAIINVNTRYNIKYSSIEGMYPNLTFSNLLNMDSAFSNNVISSMKMYSSRRGNIIEYIEKEYPIKLFNYDIHLKNRRGSKEIIRNYDFIKNKNQLNSERAIIFDNPNVLFRDINRNIIEVNKFTNYRGYPGDLFKPEVYPYDTPDELNIEVITETPLKDITIKLLGNMVNGFGKYPSYEELFRTKLNITNIRTTDELISTNVYDEINVKNTDLVLLVGSKISTDPIDYQLKYTHSKNECLKRGIPSQFLENAPALNKMYDRSLESKSTDSETLFGLGLNIQSKIGAKILEISENSTRNFLPNSLIFSYNIARIFEPINHNSTQGQTPRELVKKTTPFTTPIVITNNKGTEILMQYVYEISRETELFSGERGLRIENELPREYKNVIIHKDGPFYKEEINDIKKLQNPNRRLIPISIMTNNVSRMFLKNKKLYDIVQRGSVLQLDDSTYLMSTTLYTDNMKPEERGWPNPIQINFYERGLDQKLTSEEKIQILYQIWSLTRTYLSSKIPTRRPLSIHYANKMGEFLTKLGNRNPQFLSIFRKKRNRHNYVPRIFL